jgi:hypothetical protein
LIFSPSSMAPGNGLSSFNVLSSSLRSRSVFMRDNGEYGSSAFVLFPQLTVGKKSDNGQSCNTTGGACKNVGKKLGRNKPCWCGSGKKYKRCHLSRESQERQNPWEAERELRKALSRKTCSVPEQWKSECKGVPIRAHTVPKSTSLKSIARAGHVYGYTFSFAQLTEHKGKPPPVLIGINKASTFTGFCSKHDTELFATIENTAFSTSNEQCFLLAYRALAREVYTKDASAALSEVRRDSDKGRPMAEQFAIQAHSFLFDVGLAAGQRDNYRHLAEMQNVLATQDYSRVKAYVIELKEPPPVMCSGGIFPEETFDGEMLHDLGDPAEHADLLTITSFYDGTNGYVALVWLEGSDERCMPFVESLCAIPTHALTNALIRMFFECLENVFIQPDWWEALSMRQQASLNDRMWGDVDLLASGKSTGNIRDDAIEFPSWTVLNRRAVGWDCANNNTSNRLAKTPQYALSSVSDVSS